MAGASHVPFDLRNSLDDVLAHPESMVPGRRQTKLDIYSSTDIETVLLPMLFETSHLPESMLMAS